MSTEENFEQLSHKMPTEENFEQLTHCQDLDEVLSQHFGSQYSLSQQDFMETNDSSDSDSEVEIEGSVIEAVIDDRARALSVEQDVDSEEEDDQNDDEGDDQNENEDRDKRLKAAVHQTTLRICKGSVGARNEDMNKIVVAAISEATWKQFEAWAIDLEMFAKHGKRSTVNADDVRMLIRKSPKLLEHLDMLQEQMNASKVETKKKTKKNKQKDTSATVKEMDIDEDSRT